LLADHCADLGLLGTGAHHSGCLLVAAKELGKLISFYFAGANIGVELVQVPFDFVHLCLGGKLFDQEEGACKPRPTVVSQVQDCTPCCVYGSHLVEAQVSSDALGSSLKEEVGNTNELRSEKLEAINGHVDSESHAFLLDSLSAFEVGEIHSVLKLF
jgi:hypothetical protein